MESNPAPRPLHGVLVAAIVASAGLSSAQDHLWVHTGGGFASGGGLAAMVGQMPPSGGDGSLQAGYLAHPAFLNLPPLASDTTVEVTAGTRTSIAWQGDDVDGRVVDARVVQPPSHGTAGILPGLLELQVDPGFAGLDSIGFVLLDDQGAGSDTAWVRLRVKDGTSSLASRPLGTKVSTNEVRLHKVMARLAETGPGRGLSLGGGIFDPSGTTLSLLLSGPASVGIQIYDNLGTLVAHARQEVDEPLWRGLPSSGDGRRKLTARWDLRDQAGRPVAEGVYLWRILVAGRDGQKMETIRKTGVKP